MDNNIENRKSKNTQKQCKRIAHNSIHPLCMAQNNNEKNNAQRSDGPRGRVSSATTQKSKQKSKNTTQENKPYHMGQKH